MRKSNFIKQITICTILISALSLNSCIHKIETPASPVYCYTNDIAPILSSNCMMAGCHGSSSAGEINLSSYQQVMELVAAGDPEASELYNVVSSTWGTFMPPKPNNPLNEVQRSIIYTWIAQGAKDVCPDTSGTPVHVVDSICFSNNILPVFVSHCTMSGCHNITTQAGDYVLTNYQSIVSKGIVPGNAGDSKIFRVLSESGDDRMPPLPYNALTPAQKDTIGKWINEGAKNTFCSGKCDTAQYTYSLTISKIIQSSCSGCHSDPNPAFNLTLATHLNVQTIAASGLLLQVINQTNNKPLMPPGSPLLQCKKTQIEKWVNAGMLDN